MLTWNPKTANTQFIIQILIPITKNGLVYVKKIGNYQQMFYVITKKKIKKMVKTETETTLTLESLDFIH